MPRPRRHQKRQPANTRPEWFTAEKCVGCGKKSYYSKRAAKCAARAKHPDDHMSVYQCRSDHPLLESPTPWHYGHLNELIRDGVLSRGDLYDRKELALLDKCSVEGCDREELEHPGPCLKKNRAGDWQLLDHHNDNDEESDANSRRDGSRDAPQGAA